jgi:adenylate kinase family enzyme
MERVAIVGPAGAGKSWLARRLGELTGLPVIHLDLEFWRPGWQPTPLDEWTKTVERLAAAERWIIDGDFVETMPVRFSRADAIVFMDMPRWRCYVRLVARRLTYRRGSRPDMPAGCDEGFDLDLLRWIWRYPSRTKPRVLGLMREAGPGTRLITLRTPGQVRTFLSTAAQQGT